MTQRAMSFLESEKPIWGPIFLLSTLALSTKTSIPFDLLFIALIGFYLCARLQIRGCVYALILLGVGAGFKHALISNDHLWQLCIEGSLACGFLITALSFEQGSSLLASLESQMEVKKASLVNLEEELAKAQEASQNIQIYTQEKIAALQKELDDLQSDHSSILILNEVLRKTTARHVQENEALNSNLFELNRQKEILRAEYEECKRDLSFISNTEEVVAQNKQLMKELNAARYEKEQTHLINETLARLYARESLKAKEAGEEAESFAEQLSIARREVERIGQPLKEQLAAARDEISTLMFQFEKASTEANQVRAQLMKLGEIQSEKNFLKERLQAALDEIASLKVQEPTVSSSIPQEKLQHLMQIEVLFKQLKKQFEEKNQVLHQARVDLFKVDTEVQKLRMEKAAFELSPLPKEVEEQLEEFGTQIIALEEENRELQELITVLADDPGKQKKK